MQSIKMNIQCLFMVSVMVCVGMASNVKSSVRCDRSMVSQKSVNNNICSNQDLDSRFSWYDGLQESYRLLSDADKGNLDEDSCYEIIKNIETYFEYAIMHLKLEIFVLSKKHEECARIKFIAPTLSVYLTKAMDIAVEENLERAVYIVEIVYRVLRLLVNSPVMIDPIYTDTINQTEQFREIIEGLRANDELSKPNYCVECNKPFFIPV